MSRFNLIDEQWIPVRFIDGTRGELGIHETLRRSKEIATIEDSSPLIVGALHRFLLAVLYRALEGPTDFEQARAYFQHGIPESRIAVYLGKWRDRFWLFDEEHPFGQNPNVGSGEIEPWTKLTAEYNATTNKVLFDHTDAKNPNPRGPQECARWLLATMAFSISGGRGYYPSPSPNAIMCIPLGRDLFETLCYCLVPYRNREVMEDDSALWEREPATLPLAGPKRPAFGYADLYTWQSRMILLEEVRPGEVAFVRFVAGAGFENPSSDPDPMQAYEEKKDKGLLPVQFREGRATWRDFDSLLPDAGGRASLTLQNALRLMKASVPGVPRALLVLGLKYEPPNANVSFWRMERFALPEALREDRFVREEIRKLLIAAKEAESSLWSASQSFARDLIGRGEHKPDKKAVAAFVKQMPISPWYWSALEARFNDALREFTTASDFDDIRGRWLTSVRETLGAAWAQHSVTVSTGDAWAIRALARADGLIRRKLKELDQEIALLQPRAEGA